MKYAMKKIIFAILVGLTAIVFTACTKEAILVGTKWLGASTEGVFDLSFGTTDFSLINRSGKESLRGNYVFEYPKITMVVTSYTDNTGQEHQQGTVYSAKVKGKILTWYFSESSTTEFIKQE